MFVWPSYPMGQTHMLNKLTESGNCKMASFKTEISISQLVDKILCKIEIFYFQQSQLFLIAHSTF